MKMRYHRFSHSRIEIHEYNIAKHGNFLYMESEMGRERVGGRWREMGAGRGS